MVNEEFPPSYQPRQKSRRPSARGAKVVGKKLAPAVNLNGNDEISFDFSQLRNQELFDAASNLKTAPKQASTHQNPSENYSAQGTSDRQKQNSKRPKPIQPPSFAPSQHDFAESKSAAATEAETFAPVFYPANKAPRRLESSFGGDSGISGEALPQHHRRLQSEFHSPNITGTTSRNRNRFTAKKFFGIFASIILVCVLAFCGWGAYLYSYGANKMHQIAALSGAANTSGTTYLIAGSDQRQGEQAESVPGKRSDTIMLLHLPESGTPALISIPRDTYASIPDYGGNKINASFALGGAPLLVKTVEQLSGLTIDHYIEIGMDGVVELTDAVGGINVCYDRDVADPYSELTWTAGCHDVDGKTALAFSRMRYQDPEGDIGRAKRQRQVVSKILEKAISKDTFFNPFQQKRLVGAGASILTADEADSLWDVGMSAFALKKATGSAGVTGTPPISSLNYHAAGMSGAAVLLDPERIDQFWSDLRQGTLTPEKYDTIHAGE